MTEMGEDTSNSSLVTQFEAWTQRVYEEVSRYAIWKFSRQSEDLTTVASQAEYSIDINAMAITAARIDPDDDPIDFKSKEEMIKKGFDMEETGEPRFWYHAGFDQTTGKNKIGLWPIPSSIMTIELVQFGQPIALATGDNIPLPQEFMSVVHSGVKALNLGNEKDYEGQKIEFANYRDQLERLRLRYAHPKGQRKTFEPTDVPGHGRAPLVRFPPGQFSN
jgi:hypothetical protein